MLRNELPIPAHFDPQKVGKVWRVDYQKIAKLATDWRKTLQIPPAAEDKFRVYLIVVDVQNTFCIPEFELYVGGRSGTAAVEDNRRLSEFIYRNLNNITQIAPTLDTHQAIQVFHSIFLVDENGEHPEPFTLISVEDVQSGRWRFNPAIAQSLEITPEYGQQYLEYYTRRLRETGKYELTIWPYHAMLGGIGHALVAAVEEAIFFHAIARCSQPDFHIKGNHPLTEHYSVLGPEVSEDQNGKTLAGKSERMLRKVRDFDMVIVAGEAKSHCVAWTIADLLDSIRDIDPALAHKIYVLEDCTSPVVVPGAIDYTEEADAAFRQFEKEGVRLVRSTEPMLSWPGVEELIRAKQT